jgi:hypothetical protein
VPRLILHTCVGYGRTGQVWKAETSGWEEGSEVGGMRDVVVKIVSDRHVGSVVRETLFYTDMFPNRPDLDGVVPRYFGTYASVEGGWFAIVLEDVGTMLEGAE